MTIPGANLPPLFIPHQLSFCIAIPGFGQNNHYFISFLKNILNLLHCFRYSRSLSANIRGVRARVADLYSVCCNANYEDDIYVNHFSFQGCTHPCLPCAHPPLVEPVAKCHGADQAAKDDRGIEHLETKVLTKEGFFLSTKEIRTCLAGILRKLIGA